MGARCWAGMGAAVGVELDAAVRKRLTRVAVSVKGQVRAVLRARIVLAAADCDSNGAIARQLDVSVNTVRKWRGRFAAAGLDGLRDAARSGRPRIYGPRGAGGDRGHGRPAHRRTRS